MLILAVFSLPVVLQLQLLLLSVSGKRSSGRQKRPLFHNLFRKLFRTTYWEKYH